MFFSNVRSDNILSIVNVARSLNALLSVLVLNNRLSADGLILINSIFSIDESDLQVFFFDNRLDDRLVHIFVRRKRNRSSVDVVFYLSRSHDGVESFFDFASLSHLKLFSNFVDGGLNNGLVVSLVAGNKYVSDSSFLGVFGGKSNSLGFDNLVLLLYELRNYLFDLLVDSGSHNNSLSKGLDDLLGDDFGLSNNSFSNYLRVSRVPLSNDLRFNYDVFGLNLSL